MDRIIRGIGLISALILTACSGQNGGSSSQGTSNLGTLEAQQLQQLNALTLRQGEIDLDFSRIDAVDEFLLTPYVVPIAASGSGSASGGGSVSGSGGSTSPNSSSAGGTNIVVDPPPPQHFVRVAGTADFILTGLDGSAFPVIHELGATAVFSADTTAGASCLATAQSAFLKNETLDIKGQGTLVQLPYFYCPPYALCAEPLATPGTAQLTAGVAMSSSDEANAVISYAVSTPIQIPFPIWIYPHIGVYYQTVDSCTSGSATVGTP